MLRVALVLAVLSSTAYARSEKTLAYPRDEAWPAAVRFLAVDEHLKILEKDGDAGYILFELKEDKQTFRGSLEVVVVQVDGHPECSFVVSLAERPDWQELAMLNRLEQKLHVELGPPAPPPDKAPPPDDKDKHKVKEPPPEDTNHGMGPPPISKTP
ncbi:MAG TPA: hypothetical protein VGM88_05410 [Kofleriaceae bacterium]|jgi:hypothetical protein